MDARCRRVYISSADVRGPQLLRRGPQPGPEGVGGETDGIYQVDRDPTTGALSAPVSYAPSPGATFIAVAPGARRLYATRELEAGGVTAFDVGAAGGLSPLGWRSTGGSMPCHVAVDPTGRYVLAANYGSGSVSLHAVADGGLGDASDVASMEAHRSHAHFVWSDPTGDRVVVTDLGADALRTYALDRARHRLELRSVAAAPPGAGPRHLVRRDGGFFVTGELSCTVLSFDYLPSSGEARLVDTVPAGGRARGQGNFPSNLMLSPDGRLCFVGVRGVDVIAVFAVRAGRLQHVDDVATLGRDPRHLAVMGRYVYVANRASGTVVTFELSADHKRLLPTGNVVEVPNPCCVLGL